MSFKVTVNCACCGADITRYMKIYPKGYKGGAYCYDCAESITKKKTKLKRKRTPKLTKEVIELYEQGLKPSEIANKLNISAGEVYRRLTE